MKINKLVKCLGKIKKLHGNVEVFLSSDREGNSFSNLGNKMEDSIAFDNKKVILFPYDEGIEIELEVE